MNALTNVTVSASRVRDTLEEIQRSITAALERMDNGQRPGSGLGSADILGHQAPFDLAVQSALLKEALDDASRTYGDKQVIDAYRAGAIRTR